MDMINQPQILVGFSDFLISLISLLVAFYFKKQAFKNYFSLLWCAYFLMLALVSFFGGLYHLLTPGVLKPPYSSVIWFMILIGMGLMSIIGWRLFLMMGWHQRMDKKVTFAEFLILGAYVLLIFQYPYFKVASIFLGCMAISHVLLGLKKYLETLSLPWFFYFLGWVTYLLGAGIQFLDLSWDALSLSNNTLYHLITCIAMGISFLSIKKLIT